MERSPLLTQKEAKKIKMLVGLGAIPRDCVRISRFKDTRRYCSFIFALPVDRQDIGNAFHIEKFYLCGTEGAFGIVYSVDSLKPGMEYGIVGHFT